MSVIIIWCVLDPSQLSVKYPDGTPASGQEVTVTARTGYTKEIFNQIYTSPEDGLIDVALGDLDINITSLDIFVC